MDCAVRVNLAQRVDREETPLPRLPGQGPGDIPTAIAGLGSISRMARGHKIGGPSLFACCRSEVAVQVMQLIDNIGQAAAGIQDMTRNVTQAAEVSQSITTDILNVKQSSDELKNAGDMLRYSSGELSRMGGALKKVVDRFRI